MIDRLQYPVTLKDDVSFVLEVRLLHSKTSHTSSWDLLQDENVSANMYPSKDGYLILNYSVLHTIKYVEGALFGNPISTCLSVYRIL